MCGECADYAGDFKAFAFPRPAPKPRFASKGAPLPTELQRLKDDELELREDYARIFKEALERKGWEKKKASHELNITIAEINGFEAGRLRPTIDQAKRIECVLGCKLLEPAAAEEIDLEALARENMGKSTRDGASLASIVTIKKKKANSKANH
ncbi:MAG: helix-turn-helix domain-containing protein [Candidatus Norongarragalinales archaeon]